MAHWLERFYEADDAGRVEDMLAMMADDVEVRSGSHRPVRGKERLAPLLAAIDLSTSPRHEILDVWDVEEGTSVVRMDVHYTRPDGTQVVIPSMDLFRHSGGLITAMQVYWDPSKRP